jgi:polyhydroxybutyrate depolymerase
VSRSRATRFVPFLAAVVLAVAATAVAPGSMAGAVARPSRMTRPTPRPLASKSGAYLVNLSFGGRARDYRLHVPPAAASGAKLPLILNLHGATQNAILQEFQSQMDASSDRDGYLVAYPDGTRISTVLDPDPVAGDAQYGWNAGQCCGLPNKMLL